MPIKVVPFEEKVDGTWRGKFGRLEVVVMPGERGTYWRGPDRKVVLRRPMLAHTFSARGCFSGMGWTLPAAFERAEIAYYQMHGTPLDQPLYAMTEGERAREAEAARSAMLDAIEADRIAFERGWEMAIDVLPDLRSFAETEGLFPFDVPLATPTS